MGKAKQRIAGVWVDAIERQAHQYIDGAWIPVKVGDHVRGAGDWRLLTSSAPSVRTWADAGIYDTDTGRHAMYYLPAGLDMSVPRAVHIALGGADIRGTDLTLVATNGIGQLIQGGFDYMIPTIVGQIGTSDEWTAAIITKLINKAVDIFNVKLTQIHISGYSLGGKGGIEKLLTSLPAIASVLSFNTTPTSITTTSQGGLININGTAVFVTSSMADAEVTPFPSFEVVDNILAGTTPPRFAPQMFNNWDSQHDRDSWNTYGYNTITAPFHLERDYMQKFDTDYNTTCALHVSYAESEKTFIAMQEARLLVAQMATGAPKTALQARITSLNTALTTTKGNSFVACNWGGSTGDPGYPVNHMPSAVNSTTYSALTDTNGNVTSHALQIINSVQPAERNNSLDGPYMGVTKEMFKSSFLVDTTNLTFRLTGLNPAKYYNLFNYVTDKSAEMFATGKKTGIWMYAEGLNKVQAQSQRTASYNTRFETGLYGCQPTALGVIDITIKPIFGYQQAPYQAQISMMVYEEVTTGPDETKAVRINFAASAASIPGWLTMAQNPATAVRTGIHSPTGVEFSTVSTAAWVNIVADFFGSDTEALPGSYPPDFPEAVCVSSWLNYNLNFNGSNYGGAIGTSGGVALQDGLWMVKFFAATQYDGGGSNKPTRLTVVSGGGGRQTNDLTVFENRTDVAVFIVKVINGSPIMFAANKPFDFANTLLSACIAIPISLY